MKKASLFFVTLLTLCISCKKSETPSFQLTCQIKAKNTYTKLLGTSIINWTSSVANPTLIQFKARQGTSVIEQKSTNATQINPMSSTNTYFGTFTIPGGTYYDAELIITLNKNGSVPALQFNGEYSNGLFTRPVTFIIDSSHELRTILHNVTLPSNKSFIGEITLDLSSLLSMPESLLMSATTTSGTIVISKNSNTDLYNMIFSQANVRLYYTFKERT